MKVRAKPQPPVQIQFRPGISPYSGTNGSVLRVGLVYMATAFVLFLLLGLGGLLMRLNHSGILPLSADWFYRILTLHGSGMVAANLLAAMGGIAAVLSRSVRLSVRWLWATFVIYFLGAGFVILATLVGGFAAGWTVLHPLPFESMGAWSIWAALAMYVGYLFVAVAYLIYCLTIIVATASAFGGLRGALAWNYLFSGGRDTSAPVPRPTEILATVIAIDGIITVLAGAIYLVPLFAQAAGLIGSVDVLFAKNMLFLFGHTLVNSNLYLAAGLVYATLPFFTGREWKTSWPIALALNLTLVLILVPWPHHLYQDFAQPFPLQVLGEFGSYASAMPVFLVTIIGGLSLIYRSGMRWTVPSVLMALGLWGWVFGGIGALVDSTVGVNQVMHNTLWVPAHFHTYYLLGAVAFDWAYLYHLVTELSGSVEAKLSKVAAWLYGIGGIGFVMMFFLSGSDSVPRRYAAHLPQWQVFAQIAIPFVIILAIGIAWLTIEMLLRFKAAWQRTGTAA